MPTGDIIMRPTATWGHPSSVTRERFRALPEPMQREGVLMLAEMGVTQGGILRQLDIDLDACRQILADRSLWKRAEPDFAAPKDEPRGKRRAADAGEEGE
jgi:hypothetical protein